MFWDQVGSSRFSKGIILSLSTVCEVEGFNEGLRWLFYRLVSESPNLTLSLVGDVCHCTFFCGFVWLSELLESLLKLELLTLLFLSSIILTWRIALLSQSFCFYTLLFFKKFYNTSPCLTLSASFFLWSVKILSALLAPITSKSLASCFVNSFFYICSQYRSINKSFLVLL